VKSWLIIIGLLLSLVLIGSTACSPLGGEVDTQQLVEVERGDLEITVSGSGNIEVYDELRLTFGISGKVEEIFVKEGDRVSEGDVIASLETDSLELALAQAEVAYAQAELAVTEAEIGVIQAEGAVIQAEVVLKNAEISLEQTAKTSSVSDIRIAQAEVDTAKRNLDEALWVFSKYDPGTPGYDEYQKAVILAEARVNTAEDLLDAMLLGHGTKEVIAKQQAVVAAEQALETARQSLELVKLAPGLATQSLELSAQSRNHAQKQLDKASITASFNGTIAKVYVDEGDTVLATSMIVHLVESDRMKVKVQVDEIDIPEMEIGQRAIIEVDALPDLPIEGKVSFISLLPTVEAGVIVYNVTVDFDVPERVGLRAGMSATADIVIDESVNVILVPSRAVKRDDEGNTIVDVVIVGGTESKIVVTGISDGFQTEIISGLEEGEMVTEK